MLFGEGGENAVSGLFATILLSRKFSDFQGQ